MASGVAVNKECEDVFQLLQRATQDVPTEERPRFITFKLSDDNKEIVVDHVEKRASKSGYKEFVDVLHGAKLNGKQDCRYAVIDYVYRDEEEKNPLSKIVFVLWTPDSGPSIKQKMLYTSSVKALKQKLVGVHKEMQCNDDEDLDEEAIRTKCTK